MKQKKKNQEQKNNNGHDAPEEPTQSSAELKSDVADADADVVKKLSQDEAKALVIELSTLDKKVEAIKVEYDKQAEPFISRKQEIMEALSRSGIKSFTFGGETCQISSRQGTFFVRRMRGSTLSV